MAQIANTNALVHGVRSEAQIRPLARAHKRRVLRQIGLSPRDLGPIGKAHLDLYCRLASKVDLCDRYLAERGLIRDDGEPEPILKVYVSLTNSTRLALARLEAHVQARVTDPHGAVLDWVDGLGREDDGDDS